MHKVPNFSSVTRCNPFFLCFDINQVAWALAVTFCIFWFIKSFTMYIYHVLRYNYTAVGFCGLKPGRQSFYLDPLYMQIQSICGGVLNLLFLNYQKFYFLFIFCTFLNITPLKQHHILHIAVFVFCGKCNKCFKVVCYTFVHCLEYTQFITESCQCVLQVFNNQQVTLNTLFSV